MGVPKIPHNQYSCAWTKEEKQIVIENYSKMTAKQLTFLIPQRSECTIRDMASVLGLHKKISNWSEEETKLLQDDYSNKTSKELSIILNRGTEAINQKANKMGLKKPLAFKNNSIRNVGYKNRGIKRSLENRQAQVDRLKQKRLDLQNCPLKILKNKSRYRKKPILPKENVDNSKRILSGINSMLRMRQNKVLFEARTEKIRSSMLKIHSVHKTSVNCLTCDKPVIISSTNKFHKLIKYCSKKCGRANQIFPKHDTSIEVKIQNFLKELKIDFFTHQYIKGIKHGYQCDVLIPSMNLVIECDGNYWHKYPIGTELDHLRTKEMLEKGFKVLRLWEYEINKLTLESFKGRLYGN